jgi:hypothetical protein
MREVHIFGVDHFHQNLETKCVTPYGIEDECRQKAELACALHDIIRKYGVKLVAEEGKLDGPCLGWRIAKECDIGYIDITMPIQEREKRGVKTPDYNREEDGRRIAYRIFEQYMVKQVISHGAQTVLLMCGRRHLAGLRELFKAAQYHVRTYDINDYPWYRGIPMEGADGVIGYRKER